MPIIFFQTLQYRKTNIINMNHKTIDYESNIGPEPKNLHPVYPNFKSFLYECECGLKTDDYLEWKKCECKPIKTRGGKRPNSGRPKQPPTTTIAFRVKVEHAETLKLWMKEKINQLKKEV